MAHSISTLLHRFSHIVTNEASYLVIGALLSGLIGIFTTWLVDKRRANASRQALGALLHGELLRYGANRTVIGSDPPTADLIQLKAIDPLLAPGILDPRKDADLIMELIFLNGIVITFHEKARTYNQAWLTDSPAYPRTTAKTRENLLCTSLDYRDAHERMTRMMPRITKGLRLTGHELALSPPPKWQAAIEDFVNEVT